MPQRNGHKRVENVRREVREGLRILEQGRDAAVEATNSLNVVVREHPLASVIVAALAGIGAALCLKMLLR